MWIKGALVGALVEAGLSFGAADTGAQSTIGVGNDGWGACHANGGAAGLGNINSGGNEGSDIGIGNTWGEVDADGGDWSRATDIHARQGGSANYGGSGGGFSVGFPF